MKDQWIEWLQDKQRHFFYGVTLTIAAFFVAFQLFGKFHKPGNKLGGMAGQALENAATAQQLIAANEGEKAALLAEGLLERACMQTPEYAAFARGSLLIAKGELRSALEESIALKEKIDSNAILFGFNLVRIASLYRALESPLEEKSALEELDVYLSAHKKAASVLTECFCDGGVTLSDYISERKRPLEPV